MYDNFKLHKNILCIDIKSFYASVEANYRGLNIFEDYLVVADETRGEGAITLAITPALKAQGIGSRSRLFQIPPKLRDKVVVAKPRMNEYVKISTQIYEIYASYFDVNDIYVYSIDEVFIDVTGYLKMYDTTPFKLALALKRKILDIVNVHVCVGIGPNMLLSKFALDIESKNTKYEIAEWTYDNFKSKLWPIKDLSQVWGIGKPTQNKLRKIGVYSMGDLAQMDLEVLHKNFGVKGLDLSMHANGIDPSILQESKSFKSVRKSIGIGQVLFEEYTAKQIETIVLEMLMEVIIKLKALNLKANGVHLHIGESRKSEVKGFSMQKKIPFYFDSYFEIQDVLLDILKENIHEDILIKRMNISLFGLKEVKSVQTTLFKKSNSNLDKTISEIKNKYGKNSILLGISKTKEGNQEARNKLIGGHNGDVEKEK